MGTLEVESLDTAVIQAWGHRGTQAIAAFPDIRVIPDAAGTRPHQATPGTARLRDTADTLLPLDIQATGAPATAATPAYQDTPAAG